MASSHEPAILTNPYAELCADLGAHYGRTARRSGDNNIKAFVAGNLRPEHVARLPAAAGATLLSAVRHAAALSTLENVKYAGSAGEEEEGGGSSTSADGSTGGCAICIQDFKAGDELSVVPCSGKHRFHGRCLAVWFARKRLCPLCRHALQ